MLNTLRKNRKTITGLIIAAFCAVLMIGFGMDTYYHQPQVGAVAKVDGEEISYRDFTRRQEDLTRQLRSRLGDNFELFAAQLNIKQQALDSLISERLLQKFTGAMGLTASRAQIENKILESPYFEGKFTKSAFQGYLRALGMTAAQLEDVLKQELVRTQLSAAVTNLTYLTDAELRSQFEGENTAIQLRYIAVQSKDFNAKVNTKDEEKIAAYFESSKEKYRTPRQVRFTFVQFKPADFLAKVTISEEDLRNEYGERSAEFAEPPQLHLRHILIKKPSKLEEALVGLDSAEDSTLQSAATPVELKKKQAEAILARLQAGEDFSKVAAETSEEPTDKDKGGDMGWVTYDKLPEALSKAASDLDVLEFSNVIETEEGFEIIFVEEGKPRRVKDFEEVRAQLEHELKQNDAPLYTRIAADEFVARWQRANDASPTSLSSFAASEQLVATSSNGFINRAAPEAPFPQAMIDKALELNPGDQQIVELEGGSYVLSVEEVKEPMVPSLAEVRDRVVAAFTAEQARNLAQGFVDEIIKSQPKSLSEVAAKHGLSVKETELVKKSSASAEPFIAPGLREVAFNLPLDKPVANRSFKLGDTIFLIELTKKELPSEQEYQEKRTSLLSTEQQQAESRVMEVLLEVLRAQANVWVNPDLFESI